MKPQHQKILACLIYQLFTEAAAAPSVVSHQCRELRGLILDFVWSHFPT